MLASEDEFMLLMLTMMLYAIIMSACVYYVQKSATMDSAQN